jgi:hypothetical protein
MTNLMRVFHSNSFIIFIYFFDSYIRKEEKDICSIDSVILFFTLFFHYSEMSDDSRYHFFHSLPTHGERHDKKKEPYGITILSGNLLLFYSILFYSILFYSTLLYSSSSESVISTVSSSLESSLSVHNSSSCACASNITFPELSTRPTFSLLNTPYTIPSFDFRYIVPS